MSKAILDSSLLVGYFDKGDVWHSDASRLMARKDIEGVLLDCVLNEVFSVLCRRVEERGQGKKLTEVIGDVSKKIPGERIVWTYLDITHYYKDILSLMKEHQGKLNFHDCLIALVARDKNIGKIASFDEDFDRIPWLERIV